MLWPNEKRARMAVKHGGGIPGVVQEPNRGESRLEWMNLVEVIRQ